MIAAQSHRDRLPMACKRVLVPPHPLNWTKLHPKLTVLLLRTLILRCYSVSGPMRWFMAGPMKHFVLSVSPQRAGTAGVLLFLMNKSPFWASPASEADLLNSACRRGQSLNSRMDLRPRLSFDLQTSNIENQQGKNGMTQRLPVRSGFEMLLQGLVNKNTRFFFSLSLVKTLNKLIGTAPLKGRAVSRHCVYSKH